MKHVTVTGDSVVFVFGILETMENVVHFYNNCVVALSILCRDIPLRHNLHFLSGLVSCSVQ